jgi:hypothetical protein
MISKFRFYSLASFLFLASTGWLWSEAVAVQVAPADDKEDDDKENTAKPVESDMHEFMEYLFQPPFKRLKSAMAAESVDSRDWKAIKSDSLILAESGNLLLDRLPEADAADWIQHSVQVREFGGQLYRAAKAKDYANARKHYESMITNCNACHQQFADGEHILAP